MAIIAPTNEELLAQFQAALGPSGGMLPNFYVNGFGVATNATDVTLVLRTNNREVAVANLAYATVKTLRDALSQALADYEKATGTEVQSISVIQSSLGSIRESKNAK